MTDLDREFNAMCDKVANGAGLKGSVNIGGQWFRIESMSLGEPQWKAALTWMDQWLVRNADKPISRRGLTPDPDPLQDPQR